MINFSQETEALARRLAAAENVTVQCAVRRALEAEARAIGIMPAEPGLPRDRSPEAIAARRACITRIVGEIAALPILDRRAPHEIMDDLNA